MKISSAKAKGRRASAELKSLLLKAFPDLGADDINVTSSGCTGEDLMLSPKARELLPFVFEVKNQERLNVWAALAQAQKHDSSKSLTPVVCFTRNRAQMYAVIPVDRFIELVTGAA